MLAAAKNVKAVNKVWNEAKGFFSVPKTIAEYESLVSILDNLIDKNGDKELINTLSVLIGEYEDKHITIKDSNPVETLIFLMEQNGLKQKDLEAEIGKQSVVSAILNGKRELNSHHIRALSKRFNVSADVFF
jgi:HTH-type transcriptional regulator/antitoxin HigA